MLGRVKQLPLAETRNPHHSPGNQVMARGLTVVLGSHHRADVMAAYSKGAEGGMLARRRRYAEEGALREGGL